MCCGFLKSCARNTVTSEVRMTIMRKKSKKKQIVAMALALSVFASTFGTLGAAAEDAGALPVDAEKSSFTVVAVALDGSENQSPTPPPERN